MRPIDAAVVVDAEPDAPLPVPADAAPAEPQVKAKPKQQHKPCPACGIGCPHGMPSRAVDENGCSVCKCEDLMPKIEKQP